MIKETSRSTSPGVPMLILLILLLAICVAGMILVGANMPRGERGWPMTVLVVATALDALCLAGLFMVQPNQGAVLLLFGKYTGTVRTPGLNWVNSFFTKKRCPSACATSKPVG